MTEMADATRAHVWGNTEAYEAYMGRWSRPVAEAFVAWLTPPPGLTWLDVGCGTGALTRAILDAADSEEILGVDPSADFIGAATAQIVDPRVRCTFAMGDARALPVASDAYDAVVAGLALNFVPDPEAAAREMVRAARPGGTVAAYVWDYGGEMQLVRTFWQAAIALDPAAAAWDQGRQFPICQPEPLAALFRRAGLAAVVGQAIAIPTTFRDFDDYWEPHLLGGSGVTQRYATSLGETERAALRERLQTTLPIAADGSIPLIARAWAVRGRKESQQAGP
jgi:SAM-dependent methyltransferase